MRAPSDRPAPAGAREPLPAAMPPRAAGPRRALLLVDIQVDFLPGGALPVPDGGAVVRAVAALRARAAPAFAAGVYATQDWHPPGHSSFAAAHPGRADFDALADGRVLWPVHCVQGSRGAEFAPGLAAAGVRVVRKGTDARHDSYSGFEDDRGVVKTELEAALRAARADEVYICGLATEYCVKFTALHAAARGFRTFLVEDACRGMSERGVADALAEMRRAGVVVIASDSIGD